MGVEPTLDLRPNLISNQALSATQPSLRQYLGRKVCRVTWGHVKNGSAPRSGAGPLARGKRALLRRMAVLGDGDSVPGSLRLASGTLLLAIGCVPALPPRAPERPLVRDLARVVEVRGGVGWLVDESELESVLPDAMKSTCQVDAPGRSATLSWLDQEIARQGGDVAAAWRARGKDLGKVSDLLMLTRVRLLLRRADEWAGRGRCPFWLEASDKFYGVQTQGHRLILTLEGGGRFTEEVALGQIRYGGGGSGRVLVGYGIGEVWALSGGIEMGGSALFTNVRLGEQTEFPQLVGEIAAPVVLRWQYGLTAHAEVEAGLMGYVDRGSADPATGAVKAHINWGMRLGAALGGTYLRLQRGFIPKFAVAVTVDVLPAVDGRAGLTQVGIGARTGLDFSRWRP